MTTKSNIEVIIPGREKDLGGFSVRRVLPFAHHRTVGPFVFFDHMGPAEVGHGKGMEVRPHPHVNLSTVTYLFEGKVRHQDSLGNDINIEPGAINLMTAGRGIVHSERMPDDMMNKTSRMDGIQLWMALPEKDEECDPTFAHHPKETLPEFKIGKSEMKLLLGTAFGHSSPAKLHSDLFYIELKIAKGEILVVPSENRESAAYVVKGSARIDNDVISTYSMAVAQGTDDLTIEALEDSHIMLLGGKSVGPRFMYWNFVSSSKERLEEAKKDWAQGPTKDNPRFFPVPGDDQEFIPLPAE